VLVGSDARASTTITSSGLGSVGADALAPAVRVRTTATSTGLGSAGRVDRVPLAADGKEARSARDKGERVGTDGARDSSEVDCPPLILWSTSASRHKYDKACSLS
jgi:hypothetical protein